jgi:phospholipase C
MASLIKHIVVVMLENRSFDSMFGYLYQPNDLPKNYVPALAPGEPEFYGLEFADTNNFNNFFEYEQAIIGQLPVPGVRATNSPGSDPGEEYEHVNNQLFGSLSAPAPGAIPTMKGFVTDYQTQCSGNAETIKQIMHMYTPADLPILSKLAKAYAVSDMWFASVPTQTNANRAFSICGTSDGLVDNGFLTKSHISQKLADDRFTSDTIWNVLDRHGNHDWAIFWEDVYPPVISQVPYTRRVFPKIENIPQVDSHFYKMDEFYNMVSSDQLPFFSYIEPSWGGSVFNEISVMGNEYHPPSDITPGEKLLKDIYECLLGNQDVWVETLLVIVFDEHGGTFDHISPPWGAIPPWGNQNPGVNCQYQFGFDRFGVRVPAVLVSPGIAEGTVFRSPTEIPYDHASILATILQLSGIDPSEMGQRVANAPTFTSVVNRSPDRTDNIFALPVLPPIREVNFGDPFHLKHMSGDYVVEAYSGIKYYFPRLDNQSLKPVLLDFRNGWGNVLSGSTVQIRTGEYLQPEATKELTFAGIRNFLGAWGDEHDCYYYSSDDAKNYEQQYWTVSKVDGSSGSICYGDKIFISNNFPAYLGQKLQKDDQYITTSSNAQDWWEILPLFPIVIINQYHATDPWRYYYNISSNNDHNWINDGPVFTAFGTQVTGTIPIYQYYATDPWRYYYSTSSSNDYDWSNDGIVFYAYP